MGNEIRFNWLAKKTLITSSPLLLVLSIPEISWAGEIPSRQTEIAPLFLDSQPQAKMTESKQALLSYGEVPFTSVSELADVKPQDWAFQAWQTLAEKYDCPTANLNTSQRENRPISRYEFAAGLNACLDRLSSQFDEIESMMSLDEFRLLQRLKADFATELSSLDRAIENLEITTEQLEENLFSTTTQLRGEVLFVLADSFGDSIDSDRDETQTLFGSRARLNLLTSFFGTDVLRTRIGSTNIGGLDDVTDTVMTRLGAEGDDDSQVSA